MGERQLRENLPPSKVEQEIREKLDVIVPRMKVPLGHFVDVMQEIGVENFGDERDWGIKSWFVHLKSKKGTSLVQNLVGSILIDKERYNASNFGSEIAKIANVDMYEEASQAFSYSKSKLFLGYNLHWQNGEVSVMSLLIVDEPLHWFEERNLRTDYVYLEAGDAQSKQGYSAEFTVNGHFPPVPSSGQPDLPPKVALKHSLEEAIEKAEATSDPLKLSLDKYSFIGISPKLTRKRKERSPRSRRRESQEYEYFSPQEYEGMPDIDIAGNVLQDAIAATNANIARDLIGEMMDHFGIRRSQGVNGLLNHFNISKSAGIDGLLKKFNLTETGIVDAQQLLDSARFSSPFMPSTIPGTTIPMNWLDRQRHSWQLQSLADSLDDLSKKL